MLATARLGGRAKLAPLILGFLISLAAVLLIGEAYARLSLPQDIRRHFGQGPAQQGIYKPDPVLGADYRSYQDFHADNAARLAELGALDAPTPTWLLLGNSFVQAPGMMADTARRVRPDQRIFDLRKNEPLPLRAAQARQLLAAGLRPQRIFFVLLPVDMLHIGRRPLDFIAVNADGALATRPRWPDPPWHWLVPESRLAAIAWIRSGRSDGDPSFEPRRVADAPSPRVRDDLSRILHHLAETSRRFAVPTTVIALPNREQIFGRAGFGFQDTLKELVQRAGLDFYDARQVFADAADKRALFLPDWHFNERGNELIMQGLLEHLRALGPQAGA
jgi:hypothetical protein